MKRQKAVGLQYDSNSQKVPIINAKGVGGVANKIHIILKLE